jgi:hypothetical protein
MKKLKLIFLITCLVIISLFSCDDDDTIFAVLQNGEKLDSQWDLPFNVYQNSPDPFDTNGYTTIVFVTSIPSHFRLQVYTDDWRQVVTLLDKHCDPGQYSVIFYGVSEDGEPLPVGDYFYTLETGDTIIIVRMKIVG